MEDRLRTPAGVRALVGPFTIDGATEERIDDPPRPDGQQLAASYCRRATATSNTSSIASQRFEECLLGLMDDGGDGKATHIALQGSLLRFAIP